MKSIQPFIDIGWHTVPLKGKLTRLKDGTKTAPIFTANWKKKYREEFNENATAIGGVLTGSLSNIIAIDCDNQATYDMFASLDASYGFHFISKGKPKGGGTIIYKYPSGVALPTFSIQSDTIAIDFYSDDGFVYLPTEANTTKEAWNGKVPTLATVPETVLLLLKTLQDSRAAPIVKDSSVGNAHKINYLEPQVVLMLAKEKYSPSLFKVLTPKDFRDLETYVKFGYLHPKDVPTGRGSEYLSKVSAILGADPSIDRPLYVKTILFINTLWKDPIDSTRLDNTILHPMVDGKASIDGEVIWKYDKHWRDHGIVMTNKLGEALEVFYDDTKLLYYVINYTNANTVVFYKDTEVISHISTVGVAPPSPKELKVAMPIIRTELLPARPFGLFSIDSYAKHFNMFRQTPALAIMCDPSAYKQHYKRPEATLNFLASLIPDDETRYYLLSFLKYKLTTFEYSPVVLYFIGISGSGKDTFVQLLEAIMGSAYIARPSAKVFLEQYNGWLIDKYFVQLDEYGDQLAKKNDKEEALGRLKAYTGKDSVHIRPMRNNGYTAKTTATFISTANKTPLVLDAEDRRILAIETPNKLGSQQWVTALGGLDVLHKILFETINDFCYYLATEIPDLTKVQYMEPPVTLSKKTLIAKHLNAAYRIAYYIQYKLFDELYKECEICGCTEVFNECARGYIHEDDLLELYLIMTEGRGTAKGLSRAMSEVPDVIKTATTRNNTKSYKYNIPELTSYFPSIT